MFDCHNTFERMGTYEGSDNPIIKDVKELFMQNKSATVIRMTVTPKNDKVTVQFASSDATRDEPWQFPSEQTKPTITELSTKEYSISDAKDLFGRNVVKTNREYDRSFRKYIGYGNSW